MPYEVQHLPVHVFSSIPSLSIPESLAKILNEAEKRGADSIQPMLTPIGDYLVIAHYPTEKSPRKGKKDAKAITDENNEASDKDQNGPSSTDPKKETGKSRSDTKAAVVV